MKHALKYAPMFWLYLMLVFLSVLSFFIVVNYFFCGSEKAGDIESLAFKKNEKVWSW